MRQFREADDCLVNFIKKLFQHLVSLDKKKAINIHSPARSIIGWLRSPDLEINTIYAEFYIFILTTYAIITHYLTWYVYASCKYTFIKYFAKVDYSKVCSTAFQHEPMAISIQSILKEVMRKFPANSIEIPREILHSEGYKLILLKNGENNEKAEHITLPKNTIIYIPSRNMRCNNKDWGEDAKDFKPSRWESVLNTVTLEDMLSHQIPYMKNRSLFEIGQQQSISTQIALTVFELLTPILLREFEFEFTKSYVSEAYLLQTFLSNKSLLVNLVKH